MSVTCHFSIAVVERLCAVCVRGGGGGGGFSEGPTVFLYHISLEHPETGALVPKLLVPYQRLRDHFCRLQSLKLVIDRRSPHLTRNSILILNLEPFRALQTLTVRMY